MFCVGISWLKGWNVCWNNEGGVGKKWRNCLGRVLGVKGEKGVGIGGGMIREKLWLLVMILNVLKVCGKVVYILPLA